jgi:dihydroorotate dehydrogenase electron transfer subunit
MMKAASTLARRRGIPAQVSLEERMGCAMGCCMGCVVEVNTEPVGSHARFQRVCTEGPVFSAEAVIWR